ncbi:hypothetical protein ABTB90_19265, partial [Acinetobacter baumannii]
AQAVFDYQKDVKQQREAAAKTAQAMASAPGEAKAAETDMKPDPAKAMMPPDAMQPAMPNAAPAKEPPKPLNIIQKTFRAEALAR